MEGQVEPQTAGIKIKEDIKNRAVYLVEIGESCGTVIIKGQLTVMSYGGAGGSGGIYTTSTGSSGTGGGGYPAAGIGRWWRWSVVGADHMDGGGGFSGGSNESTYDGNHSRNRYLV